ncbi:YceI family protein [Pseudoduganella umbonata]|uniref:YceI family protein n=1 Tax=Pseudoduganella umbonata TaxID=864828 RepID=A0A4P8HNL1_9BURK|nr:YceI family protein [Pseudoduganella umbonata]MBB3221485.1 hypothetical protein [Pseudoduganella umbonata]QCP10636.1 YceI family protein [Pseudoduganella umbonata]
MSSTPPIALRALARQRYAAAAAAVAAGLLLAACAAPDAAPGATPATPPPAAPAAAQPADPFAALLAGRAAGPILRIADDALIAITVRRGGALARLGHDHVVAARRIDGRVDPAAGLAVLRFRLDEMTVDEAVLRHEAGLATQPSADAIAGTRVNMLTKVLDAQRHPFVEVRVQRGAQAGMLQADITLHGVTRRYTVPVAIEPGPQGLTARGALTLRQTDFGITPFSVMGGAMAVQDALEIRFALPARPVAPDAVR